jgi:deoxyribonuclease IV
MPERTNRIGRHLPTSGGLRKTLEAAEKLGCETARIFRAVVRRLIGGLLLTD